MVLSLLPDATIGSVGWNTTCRHTEWTNQIRLKLTYPRTPGMRISIFFFELCLKDLLTSLTVPLCPGRK